MKQLILFILFVAFTAYLIAIGSPAWCIYINVAGDAFPNGATYVGEQ